MYPRFLDFCSSSTGISSSSVIPGDAATDSSFLILSGVVGAVVFFAFLTLSFFFVGVLASTFGAAGAGVGAGFDVSWSGAALDVATGGALEF